MRRTRPGIDSDRSGVGSARPAVQLLPSVARRSLARRCAVARASRSCRSWSLAVPSCSSGTARDASLPRRSSCAARAVSVCDRVRRGAARHGGGAAGRSAWQAADRVAGSRAPGRGAKRKRRGYAPRSARRWTVFRRVNRTRAPYTPAPWELREFVDAGASDSVRDTCFRTLRLAQAASPSRCARTVRNAGGVGRGVGEGDRPAARELPRRQGEDGRPGRRP
jgi:hypothetical protein